MWLVHDPLPLLERAARTTRASCRTGRRRGTCARRCRSPGRGLRVRVGRRLGHREVGVGGRRPLREAALAEHDVEGVDVLEDRALAEQQQVGVAARADGRVRAQRAVLGEVLAGGQELALVAAPAPRRSRRRQAGSSLKNVNLTNVRSATRRRVVAAALAAGAFACLRRRRRASSGRERHLGRAAARARPSGELARCRALAGCDERRDRARSPASRPTSTSRRATGSSTRSTTGPLPPALAASGLACPDWEQIVRRADGAPADIVPGLLASSLAARGIRSAAVPAAGPAALLAARRDGVVRRGRGHG